MGGQPQTMDDCCSNADASHGIECYNSNVIAMYDQLIIH